MFAVLKHDHLQKGRIQKYSDGTYVIINKIGNHYLISPISFNSAEYCKAKEIASFDYSTPVYFRKSYEMK